MNAHPPAFQAARLKRKQFIHTGDAYIVGNVNIGTQLVIGGDLLVDGDLEAEEVFCLGKLTVTGNVAVQSLYVGDALDVGGDIDVDWLLKTGCTAEWLARLLEFDQRKTLPADCTSFLDLLAHPAIRARHAQHETYGDIQGLGDLRCGDLDCHGSLQLDGALVANDVTFVGGDMLTLSAAVDGDCNCRGMLSTDEQIVVKGELFSTLILCGGDLEAGAISAQEDIRCGGNLRAKTRIDSTQGEIESTGAIACTGSIQAGGHIKAGTAIVGEKGVRCGDDHAIFAGLALPRSSWPTKGFVSAASRPQRLASGSFVAGKKARQIAATRKRS